MLFQNQKYHLILWAIAPKSLAEPFSALFIPASTDSLDFFANWLIQVCISDEVIFQADTLRIVVVYRCQDSS